MSLRATAVALVDDDDSYREMLTATLGDRGFRLHGFADGQACLAALEQGLLAELVLLDWVQGPDVLRRLLAPDGRRRVIVLSGGAPAESELEALQYGAVDFIDKARGIDVLVPRMRLVALTVAPMAAAAAPPEPAAVIRGPLLLPSRGRAQWRGRAVGLTVAEARIASLLAANAGRPVTYRALYDQVHHAGFAAGRGTRGFERNVRTMIKRMRRKFEAIDPRFEAIRSVARFGYWWDAS